MLWHTPWNPVSLNLYFIKINVQATCNFLVVSTRSYFCFLSVFQFDIIFLIFILWLCFLFYFDVCERVFICCCCLFCACLVAALMMATVMDDVVVTSLYVTVKYLREVTPYFRKASIISEVGWELQRGFLSGAPPSPSPHSPQRADTRYLPLQLCYLVRNLRHQDPGEFNN